MRLIALLLLLNFFAPHAHAETWKYKDTGISIELPSPWVNWTAKTPQFLRKPEVALEVGTGDPIRGTPGIMCELQPQDSQLQPGQTQPAVNERYRLLIKSKDFLADGVDVRSETFGGIFIFEKTIPNKEFPFRLVSIPIVASKSAHFFFFRCTRNQAGQFTAADLDSIRSMYRGIKVAK